MALVFCMAGLYRRFREAGYASPKYLLPWRGRPIIDHIVERLWDPVAFGPVLFLANRRDQAWAEATRAVLDGFGLAPQRLVFIGDTAGQAETALLAIDELERLGDSEPHVVFHNIDTILTGREPQAIRARLATWDGYIDTFTASSQAYSYVRTAADGRVLEMREKVVISDQATSGFYGFADRQVYRDYYRRCFAGRSGGECYISSIYQAMIDDGLRVYGARSGAGMETLIAGTPAEYQALVAEA